MQWSTINCFLQLKLSNKVSILKIFYFGRQISREIETPQKYVGHTKLPLPTCLREMSKYLEQSQATPMVNEDKYHVRFN